MFAIRLGIPLRTFQEWESGRWSPYAAAQACLKMVEQESDIGALNTRNELR